MQYAIYGVRSKIKLQTIVTECTENTRQFLYDFLLHAIHAGTDAYYIWKCRLTDKLHSPDTTFRRVGKIAQGDY